MRQQRHQFHTRRHSADILRRGVTLAEVVVSTMLVGLLTVGAMQTLGQVHRTWSMSQTMYDGQGLAHQLLAEILQTRYEDPDGAPIFGREPDEGGLPLLRSDCDDVDDYHGWSSMPPRPRDDTTPMAEYSDWQRAVTVELVDATDPTTVSATDEGVKRITVTVTSPTSRITQLVGFRSRWGALENSPLLDTTIITGMSGRLQIGSEISIQGTAIVNHAEDQ